MQKYVITISGLTNDECKTVQQLESKHCIISSSNGFNGEIQEIITIIGDDPFVRAVVVQVISDLILKMGEEALSRCKFNFRFPNGRDLINIAWNKLEKLRSRLLDGND